MRHFPERFSFSFFFLQIIRIFFSKNRQSERLFRFLNIPEDCQTPARFKFLNALCQRNIRSRQIPSSFSVIQRHRICAGNLFFFFHILLNNFCRNLLYFQTFLFLTSAVSGLGQNRILPSAERFLHSSDFRQFFYKNPILFFLQPSNAAQKLLDLRHSKLSVPIDQFRICSVIELAHQPLQMIPVFRHLNLTAYHLGFEVFLSGFLCKNYLLLPSGKNICIFPILAMLRMGQQSLAPFPQFPV